MKGKAKPFRTSQDVYNQIRHDPRLEPARYVIGFESRFDGMKEIRLEHFQPGTEIPWHRIWYFRTESETVWDRRTRIDRVSSDDASSTINPAVEPAENQDVKDMKGKDLIEIGVQPGPVMGVALRVLPKAMKRLGEEGAKGALRAVLADPEAHLEHEYFADVAAKLVELNRKPVFTERERPAPYRVYGEGLEAGAVEQMVNAASLPVAVRGALMPDAHMGYGLPIGGVLATDNAVIPYAVGVDIACRMKLSILDVPVSALEERGAWLEGILERETRFGTGGSFERPNQHDVLDMDWNVTRITASVYDKAAKQLGTSGSGNHFVEYGVLELTRPDLGLEPGKYLALMSHSGSRGAGAAVANHYSRLAMDLHPELPDRLKRLAWLDLDSEAGQEYWAAMNLMGEYAKGNHAVIHRRIAKALGSSVLESIENHHNFCLPADAVIATPCGPKRMADLAEGDVVYAFDQPSGPVGTRVTRAWASGVKRLRTIQTANRRIRASLEHPILTIEIEQRNAKRNEQRLFGHYRWKPAEDLRVGDIVVCAEGYYRDQESRGEDLARFVGAFLGDGWVRHDTSNGRYTVGLAIGTKVELHTEMYRALLGRVLPDANWQVSRAGAFGLTCMSAKVWRAVQAMGLAAYSKDKRLPVWAFGLTRAEKLALLAGYLDADGSVAASSTSNHGRAVMASTNRGLLEDMRELAIACRLRITPIRVEHIQSNFGPATSYRCVLDADSTSQIPLWHPRKQVNQRGTRYRRSQGLQSSKIGHLCLPDGVFAQRIRSIQDSSIAEPVFDITVEHGSHSFVADGMVVHNCWKERHLVDGQARELLVHRKGATPAGPGVLGVIPGSMAAPAFVVRGRGEPESLESASHGAGRAMSRTKAKEQFNWKMVRPQLEAAGVKLLSAGIDENPFAYKDINAVMSAQGDLVDIVARFSPRIVKMAHEGEQPED